MGWTIRGGNTGDMKGIVRRITKNNDELTLGRLDMVIMHSEHRPSVCVVRIHQYLFENRRQLKTTKLSGLIRRG